jgi:hypothetical protein
MKCEIIYGYTECGCHNNCLTNQFTLCDTKWLLMKDLCRRMGSSPWKQDHCALFLWRPVQGCTRNAIRVGVLSAVFTSCTPVNEHWRFGWIYYLHLQTLWVSQATGKENSTACLVYSSTLTMEAVRFLKISANVYQTTRNDILEYYLDCNSS